MSDARSALDRAADLFIYAPLGLAVQLGKALPELTETGRSTAQVPLGAAKTIGQLTVEQKRRELKERLRKATEPYLGTSGCPAAASPEQQTPPPAPAKQPSAPVATEPDAGDSVAAPAPAAGDLAIPSYTALSASQIVSHLDALNATELADIRAYESANRKRKSILLRIDHLLAG